MEISIIAAGSRGDVQPYAALAVGFQRAGHRIRFLAPSDYGKLAREHQLDFVNLGGDMQSIAQGLRGQLERGNMLKIMVEMRAEAAKLIGQATENAVASCAGSDLILAGLGALSIAVTTAEALGIPFVPAFLYPFTPTSEFASVLSPIQGKAAPGSFNRATFFFAQQLMWQAGRSADNKVRTERLSLEPAPFWGPFTQFQRNGLPMLYGYSKHVIPFPKDWGDSEVVTGFWYLEPAQTWQPPANLQSFLEAGPAPIYIGFGSMVNQDPVETSNLIIEALRRSGQRGVIGSGWGGLRQQAVPDFVHVIESVPHSWLFPKMAAVVHHGGVGTTAAGLRAGVPSIITPFFGDQPFWGRRVFELGVGPKPIPKKKLDAQKLAESIRNAVTDEAMKAQAVALGSRIRAENGVSNAVETLERLFRSA